MVDCKNLLCWVVGLGFAFASPACGLAQVQVMSASPPNVEYQYQLYYPRIWGWPGPGLSLGGSLPSKGREGISSFYGAPLPVPLGAGVYVNPFAYSARLPGAPLAFGLASSSGAPASNRDQIGPPNTQFGDATQTIPPGAPIPATAQNLNQNRQITVKSSPEAIQRSLEMEAIGNEHFFRQNWTQAFINYRNAVMTAGDRPEAHVRLAFAEAALKRYPEAVNEFKLALLIDPSTGKSGQTLDSMFGPENDSFRKEFVNNVARWTKEDFRNSDRLFLLGIILLYNNDVRSGEILEAALQMPGPKDHLIALLTPNNPQTQSTVQVSATPSPSAAGSHRLPELHQRPMLLQ